MNECIKNKKLYEVSQWVEGYHVWHILASSEEEAIKIVENGETEDYEFSVKNSSPLVAGEL